MDLPYKRSRSFPSGSDGKESACNVEDHGSIPGMERPLGEGMASHSSILAWRIPRTEETGGLQSTGSLRVRHDRMPGYFSITILTVILVKIFFFSCTTQLKLSYASLSNKGEFKIIRVYHGTQRLACSQLSGKVKLL